MGNLQMAVTTDVERELPQAILFNFDELKAGLAATLKKHQGVVVTKDTMKDAKATRAELNNLKKAMNDNRISIGRAWNAPYGEDARAQLETTIFYENFEAWIAEQNRLRNFPETPAGTVPIRLECLTDGYLMDAYENTAFYQIQIKLTYKQGGTRQ